MHNQAPKTTSKTIKAVIGHHKIHPISKRPDNSPNTGNKKCSGNINLIRLSKEKIERIIIGLT